MNYAKPKDINEFLFINRYGQLIQITDKPKIVQGVKVLNIYETCGIIKIKFTIVKNSFKGL